MAKEVFTNTGTRGRVRGEDNERGGEGPEDRPNDRCLGFALPIRFGAWETGGAHHRIVQAPGVVSIYYEIRSSRRRVSNHSDRRRPHLPPHIRQWLGDARGRWEGDTLVVHTTNFTHRTNFEGSRENLHLIERFTRTGPDLLIYQATFEDPTVFTRPWTIEIPLTKKDEKENQIFESACHEGNYAMTGILAGARAVTRQRPRSAQGEVRGRTPWPLSLRSSSVSQVARLSDPISNVAATGSCGVSSYGW